MITTSFGFTTECPQFDCMDWVQQGATLTVNGQSFHAQVSPYSRGCNVESLLETVSTFGELEAVDAEGKVLLLRGEIAREQLFVFSDMRSAENRGVPRNLARGNPYSAASRFTPLRLLVLRANSR